MGDCDAPPAVANGVVDAPTLKFLSTATYTCNTGYHLRAGNVAMLTCQEDANTGDNRGVWSGPAPNCDCKQLHYITQNAVF